MFGIAIWIRFPSEQNLEKGFCLIGHRAAHTGGPGSTWKGSQIHCYGDSGTPAIYYAKKPSTPGRHGIFLSFSNFVQN